MSLRSLLLPGFVFALFALASPCHAQIVINEIMYDPPGAPDVEYVEIVNVGPVAQDVTGWFLLDDNGSHDKCFLVGTLEPGEFLVIVGFMDHFMAKYPGVTNINPNQFDSEVSGVGFAFGDGGDAARIFTGTGVLIDIVEYNDTPPWPTEPDGDGPSLELYNPGLDNSLPSSWAASINGPPEGTPGAQNSVYTLDEPPIVSGVARDIPLPKSTDEVFVTAVATDGQGLSMVELLVDTGSGFVAQLMFDDGVHEDGTASDSIFGTQLGPHPADTLVRYYVRATDTLSQITVEPPGAPQSYYGYTVDYEPPALRINEMVADNVEGLQDEFFEYDDWLEIHNAGTYPVDVGGMFLANSQFQSMEWELPSVVLEPGGFLLVWCDDDDEQGALHTNFKLSASGSVIRLFDSVDHGNGVVHGFKHGVFGQDISFGYFPDDSDSPEYLATPTPGASNNTSTLHSAICINEFQTTSASGGIDDWIELHNRGNTLISLQGWFLTDEVDQPHKYEFPPGIFIGAGQYISLDEEELEFALTSTGEEVIMLTYSDGTTGQDFFDYGPQFNDVSQGRFPNGTANWHFFTVMTQGMPNHCNGVPPLDPVTGLVFASPNVLSWAPGPGAEAYDVLRGDLGTLLTTGGDFSAAVIGCTLNNAGDRAAWSPSTPATGQGLFYLVRGVDFWCGFGTYDTGSSSQRAGRDSGIAAAAGVCP